MTKSDTADIREKIITLRAEGLSYQKIAEKIGVSKTTVLEAAGKLKKEIDNALFLRLQGILEKYNLTKEAKIEFLCQELKKLREIAGKRSYKNLSSGDLFLLMKKYQNELDSELKGVEFRTGEKEKLDITPTLEKEIKIKLEG